ncbi:hypothetical protein WMY93_017271 [Mugilogobius chulae]|uniref:Ig-like domain-containing protein n=1 Tax=Mugilogobius chulae TaxID=88201 RepID=A0AAW0NS34_9GOBI
MMVPLRSLILQCLLSASVARLNSLPAKDSFLSATVGGTITLRCASGDDVKVGAKLYWYKQKLGMKPVLVSSYFKYEKKGTLHGEFHNNTRLTLDYENDQNNLKIQNVGVFDSAVYHCMRCYLHHSDFLESVAVVVKSLNPTVEVQQSPNEDVDLGQSVILNCTVQTEGCDGPHRVHWFKQSEESAAGVLYSSGGNSDQCESKTTDSQINSCVYNLPIRNVSSEQTGTYYCAVAACGQVLFGDGTRVNVKVRMDVQTLVISVLTGALAFSSVLIMFLGLYLCRMKKKYSSLSTNSRMMTTTNEQDPDVSSLHYAALSVQPSSRRQRVTAQTDCVYSTVQQN